MNPDTNAYSDSDVGSNESNHFTLNDSINASISKSILSSNAIISSSITKSSKQRKSLSGRKKEEEENAQWI